VSLQGEIDLFNAADIGASLWAVHHDADSTVLLDLSGLTYLDSVGLALLVDTARRFALERVELSCLAPDETAAGRILRLTGLQDVLHVVSVASPVTGQPLPDP